MSEKYDLVVLGAGSGGLTAAQSAASFGVKVALLEKGKIGGDCLNTGCVPSKSLISLARKIWELNKLEPYIKLENRNISFKAIHKYVHERIAIIEKRSDNTETLHKEGIDTYQGNFSFINPHRLKDSQGQVIDFKKCIIAAGSRPTLAGIAGLKDITFLTSETIWDETVLPASLAIIGGGPVGLELGQALAMLGCKVTVIEKQERLLSSYDEEVSVALASGLKDNGIEVLYGAEIETLSKINSGVKVEYRQDSTRKSFVASKLLVAVGRTPNTSSAGLATISVRLNDKGGIKVDKYLRTNQKHIYAIGDVLGGPYFTHWAGEQGAAAAVHALFGVTRTLNKDWLPSAIFTTPEIAQVGTTEQSLRSAGKAYRKVLLPYSEIDKATAEDEDGFVSILLGSRQRILGVAIVGANASELIGYFSLMMQHYLPFSAIGEPILPYPTYSLDLKRVAGEYQLKKFNHNPFLKLYLKMRGFRT